MGELYIFIILTALLPSVMDISGAVKNPYVMSAGYIRRNTPRLHCCLVIGIFYLWRMFIFGL